MRCISCTEEHDTRAICLSCSMKLLFGGERLVIMTSYATGLRIGMWIGLGLVLGMAFERWVLS